MRTSVRRRPRQRPARLHRRGARGGARGQLGVRLRGRRRVRRLRLAGQGPRRVPAGRGERCARPARCGRSWGRARRSPRTCTPISRPTTRSTTCSARRCAMDLRTERWMLRLIDVEAALGGRGYPVGCRRRYPPGRRGRGARGEPAGRTAGGARRRRAVRGRPVRWGTPATPSGSDRTGWRALYAGTSTASLRTSGLITGGDPTSTLGSTRCSSVARRTCSTTSSRWSRASGQLGSAPTPASSR